MRVGEFLRFKKVKLYSLLLLLIASFPLYYNYSCINFYVECKLFSCPTTCGFLPLEFVIILFISSLLVYIIEFLIHKLKDKNKK